MAKRAKKRRLTYRRAEWIDECPQYKDLEAVLRAMLAAIPAGGRAGMLGEKKVEIAEVLEKTGEHPALYLRMTAHTPDDLGSAVSKEAIAERLELIEVQPPDGHEFLDGDIALRISGNHVLACPVQLTERQAEHVLKWLCHKAQLDQCATKWALEKQANVNKLKMIASSGVQQIEFDIAAYERTVKDAQPPTGYQEFLRKIVGKSKSAAQLAKVSDARAKVVYTVDRDRELKADSQSTLNAAAEVLAEDADVSGFKIVLRNNAVITSDEVAVWTYQSLDVKGKTVKFPEACTAMDAFYVRLLNEGAMDEV